MKNLNLQINGRAEDGVVFTGPNGVTLVENNSITRSAIGFDNGTEEQFNRT